MPRVFTYGPDALQGKMYDRVGPTEFIGPATLSGYRLIFNKPNMKDPREGLSNLQEDDDGEVVGALFEISRKQMEVLDGFFGGYQQEEVRVKAPEGVVKATTWVARRTKSNLKPRAEALALTQQAHTENGGEEPLSLPFDPLPEPEQDTEETHGG